jgi:glycosyltransferase involved in cell wall biosynthesis
MSIRFIPIDLVKIDVVLPFHQINDYLLVAVNSVLRSRNCRVRIILIDDRTSLDREELDAFLAKISLRNGNLIEVYNNIGKGYSNALRISQKYVNNPFVALMNSDDWIDKDRLIIQAKKLNSENANLCIGRIIKVSNNFRVPRIGGVVTKAEYSSRFLLLGSHGADATWMTTLDTWKNKISFVQSTKSSDWATALNTFKGLQLTSAKSAKYFYRLHPNQVTASQSQLRDNFFEIYPFWKTLNSSYGFPEISFEAAKLIAAPYEGISISQSDLESIDTWISGFLETLETRKQQNIARRIFSRRKVLMRISGYKVKYSRIMLIRMSVEWLISKSFSKNPSTLGNI